VISSLADGGQPRDSKHVGRLVVVIAAVLLSGAAVGCDAHRAPPAPSSSTWAPRPGLVTYSVGEATITAPARWIRTPFRGLPAPVVLPEFFLSTTALPACGDECASQDWFPPGATTPRTGVLVMWEDIEYPTDTLDAFPGDLTAIDGHEAHVYAGATTSRCPVGTASEFDAAVRVQVVPKPRPRFLSGERLDLIGCLGAGVSTADRTAVEAMLHSLRFK
jgi:hypothetical protein